VVTVVGNFTGVGAAEKVAGYASLTRPTSGDHSAKVSTEKGNNAS
jgi:hypothetical protein